MSQTEKIEKYLLGELSAQEVQQFEGELENNTELRQEVELQEAITKRVQRMAFLTALDGFNPEMDLNDTSTEDSPPKNDINNSNVSGGGQAGGNFLLKSVVGTVATVILGISAYFYLKPIPKSVEVIAKNEIEEVVPTDTNTVEQKEFIPKVVDHSKTKQVSSHQTKEESKTEEVITNEIEEEEVLTFEEVKIFPFEGKHTSIQRFLIDDFQKLKVITTTSGAKLFFPTGIVDPTKYEAIQVEVKEYLNFSTILNGMLSSRNTANEPLETDGIMYINIINPINGKPVKLDADLKVYIPKTHLKKQKCLSFVSNQKKMEGIKWKQYSSKNSYSKVNDLTPTSLEDAMNAMKEEETLQSEYQENKNKYHILTTNISSGWLNAGIPVLEDFDETVNVEVQSSINASLRLVIKGTHTIIEPVKRGDKYIFKNIPEEATVTVFGIAEIEGKQAYQTAKATMNAGEKNRELIYSQVQESDLVDFIQNIER